MENIVSNYSVKFSDGNEILLVITTYPQEIQGELVLKGFVRTGTNSYILPTKQFRAKTEDELFKEIYGFLMTEIGTEFKIIKKNDS